MNKTLIFAYKSKEEFHPEHIIEDLEAEYDRLEYGDVLEGEYQLWEYPSGKIFKIEPDRKVEDKYYYVPPNVELWMPVLTEVGIDKEKVDSAYEMFSNPPKKKSLLQKLKSKLGIG